MSILERLRSRKELDREEKGEDKKIEVKEIRKEVAEIEKEEGEKSIKVGLIDSVKLTKRDIEILRFVNRFNYVYLEHIAKMFDLSLESRRAYQVVKKLKAKGFLKSKEVFARQPQAIFLGKKGADILGVKQPRKINLSTFEHDLNNVFFYIALTKKYPNATIKSDKELLKDNYKIGETGHRPDLIIIDDNDYIAVEIELTRKTVKRLKKIKNYYLDNHEYTKVLYFCNGVTYNYISKFFNGSSLFDVLRFDDE